SMTQAEEATGGRFLLKGNVSEIRRQYSKLGETLKLFAKPGPKNIDNAEDYEIRPGVQVRVYKPQEREGILPVGVYCHGGGWALGDLNSEDTLCRILCVSVPTVLVSVKYRLAPEHKYPAGLDDCEFAYKWAVDNVEMISGNKNRFYSIGGSAGGNLAIAMALRTLEWEGPRINKGLIGIAPITVDPSVVPVEFKQRFEESLAKNTDSSMIDIPVMETFRAAYGVSSRSDPFFSVLLHKNLDALPTTYLVACEKDPLGEDPQMFHEALLRARVTSKLDYYAGYPHYFWTFPVQKTNEFNENLILGVKWVIESMP
ncbi:carboxylesterase, partial [Talaromyces proteolyticus]